MRAFPLRTPITALCAAFALAVGSDTPLLAQSAGSEPAVTGVPKGARATGLGAPQLDAPDSDLFLVHPALAGSGLGMQMSLQRYGKGATGLSLSTSRRWFGGDLSIGLALETLEYHGGAPGTRAGGIGPLFGSGSTGVSESVAALGIATQLFGMDVGVTTRGISSRFDAARKTHLMWDVGVTETLGPLDVALSLRGLGPDRTIAGTDVEPPTEVRLGFGGYGQRLGELDLGLAGEIVRRSDDEMAFGGGIELGYYPIQGRTFVGRIGFTGAPDGEADGLTLGASYWGDDLVLSWGFRPRDGGSGLHTVTLGWR